MEQTQEQIDTEISALAPEVVDAIKETPLKDTAVKDRYQEEMQYKIIRDLWHTILEDGWMYVVVWSQPRKGNLLVKCELLTVFITIGKWC